MSALLVAVSVLAMTAMLSQFGGRVAARSAAMWWAVSVLLVAVTIAPGALRPIADWLGIEFVSNLVLASLVVFLMFQSMDQVADHTETTRRMRRIVCRTAAERFCDALEPSARTGCRVLVVLPCFQEEASLDATIDAMRAVEASCPELLWCVVDDGSTDGSLRILTSRAPHRHTLHLANTGVAGALLTAFEVADSLDLDWVVQCDSDGQHPFDAIPNLLKTAEDSGADLLIGSRYVDPSAASNTSSTAMRRVGGRIISFALRLYGGAAYVSDPTSGFRVYSRRARQILKPRIPDEYPEPESIAVLALSGAVIREHPVRMLPRTAGRSSLASLAAARFMLKVTTALLGLRLRSMAPSGRVG